ncbi:MAG TPA: ATP-binding cassette domain-containing protein [Gemmataceae bacterium]|nr:ATP-binding cassette domain-containing protein [Gemmataceae bacterium]
MADVALEEVAKVYPNGVAAVRGLTLHAADGELLVLVGPSGCGKTTTLRLIAGLEEPTAGTIHIGGQVVNGLPPRRRDVAMVFQRAALYPHLRVRDNLAFGLRMRQGGALRRWLAGGGAVDVGQRVADAARMLGLGPLLDRYPHQLSGGEQQRVALGRAVVRRPAVFLLDEPLSGLDAGLRAELRRELHLLHCRLSATMIHVTHDPVEALTLADRLAVLKGGALQQVGRPEEVHDRPATRFVAEFVGWPPMNFLDGPLADGLAFGDGETSLRLPADVAKAWGPFAGRPLSLGVRPDDVALGREETLPGELALAMQVVLTETAGGTSLVRLRKGRWELTARADRGCRPTEGEEVPVRLPAGRTHLFDRDTGLALWHGPALPPG